MIEKIARKLLPPIWVLFAIAMQILLDFKFPIFEVRSGLLLIVGIGFMVLGIVITLTAANSFRRAKTPIKPFTESTAIVRSGLYRYTRNPMYLGMLIMLAGAAASLQALGPFLIVPLFFLLIDRGYVRQEEQFLLERFGNEFRELQSAVPRWLGAKPRHYS